MESKLLYATGNLYTGYPWGVVAELSFGTSELHGPFSSENEANTYAHKLVKDESPGSALLQYTNVVVVKIETPSAGRRIILRDRGYEYASPFESDATTDPVS